MKFLKNKLTVVIVILSVVFLFLIVHSIERENVSYVENGVGVTLNSIQGAINKINCKIKDAANVIFSFSEIEKENKELKEQISKLQNMTTEYNDIKSENQRLRSMVNFKNQMSEFDYVGCDIIGKCGNGYLNEFDINKGSKDGVKKRMIVVTGDGLVGQVTSVARNWSVVQTISNENIAVSAVVESTRENNGIVKGFKDGENKQLAKIYNLSLDSKIAKGDVIMTSGLGGLYPKGIRIGYVIGIEEDKGKVMKVASIEPYVDFNKLEEVFVVIPKNSVEIDYSGESK